MPNGGAGSQGSAAAKVQSREIWRMYRKPADKVRPGAHSCYWRCVYGPARGPAARKTVPHGDTTEWRFSKAFEDAANTAAGNRRKVHLRTRQGDCAVVFRYDDGSDKTVLITKAELGHTGSIYLRTRSIKGNQTQLFWTRIVDRKALKWTDEGPVSTLARVERDTQRDLLLRPQFLAAVDGEEGDMLYTAHSPLDRDHAEYMFRGQEQFEYKYITPEGMADAVASDTLWEIRRGAGDHETQDATESAALKRLQDQRDALYTTYGKLAQLSAAGGDIDGDDREILRAALEVIFGGAEPGDTAGTTIVTIVAGFVAGIADYDRATGGGAGGLASAVQLTLANIQGPYEMFSIGFNGMGCLYTIRQILSGDGPWGDKDKAAFKKALADLGILLAKGVPTAINATNNLGKVLTEGLMKNPAVAKLLADQLKPAVGAAGFLTAAISLAVMARTARQSAKSGKRRHKVKKIIGSIGARDGVIVERAVEISDLPILQDYVQRKLTRRQKRFAATSVTSAVAAVGGVCTGVGGLAAFGVITVTAANAWNPVGWTLGAIALVGGISITGYVLYRRYRRDTRHERRQAAGRIVTPEEFAARLLDFCASNRTEDSPLYTPARELMLAFGVPLSPPDEQGRQKLDLPATIKREDAIARIAAHFK